MPPPYILEDAIAAHIMQETFIRALIDERRPLNVCGDMVLYASLNFSEALVFTKIAEHSCSHYDPSL